MDRSELMFRLALFMGSVAAGYLFAELMRYLAQ